MNKKRTKKYNPAKGLKYSANRVLKGTAVLYLTSDTASKLINFHGKQLTMGPTAFKALTEVRRQWTIYLLVFRRRQDGQQYMDVGECPIDTECMSNQLDKTTQEALMNFTQQGNPVHNVNYGWIALPYQGRLSKEQIETMVNPHEPWNYLTKLEAKELGDGY